MGRVVKGWIGIFAGRDGAHPAAILIAACTTDNTCHSERSAAESKDLLDCGMVTFFIQRWR